MYESSLTLRFTRLTIIQVASFSNVIMAPWGTGATHLNTEWLCLGMKQFAS
jgi:hypothetical protein